MNYEEIITDRDTHKENVTVLYDDGTFLVHNNRGTKLFNGKYEKSILNKNIFIIKYMHEHIDTEKYSSCFAYYDLDKGVYISNSVYDMSENYNVGTAEIKKAL